MRKTRKMKYDLKGVVITTRHTTGKHNMLLNRSTAAFSNYKGICSKCTLCILRQAVRHGMIEWPYTSQKMQDAKFSI